MNQYAASIILSLLPQLPKDYKVVLLKNEFGDIEGRYGIIIRHRSHLNQNGQHQSIASWLSNPA